MENAISPSLGREVWHYLKQNHFSQTRIHYEEIAVFELLPERLQCYLRQEIYGPYVTRLPFFFSLTTLSNGFLSELCKKNVHLKRMLKEEDLFKCNKEAEFVYVVAAGSLDYRHDALKTISEGQWACEPALWLTWRHCATAVANKSCEVLLIQVKSTVELMSSQMDLLPFIKYYANIFAENVTEAGPLGLTDLWTDVEELNRWVRTSFDNVFTSTTPGGIGVNMDPPSVPSKRSLDKDKKLSCLCR